MAVQNIAHALKPNATSLGYALFLAINAAGVCVKELQGLALNQKSEN